MLHIARRLTWLQRSQPDFELNFPRFASWVQAFGNVFPTGYEINWLACDVQRHNFVAEFPDDPDIYCKIHQIKTPHWIFTIDEDAKCFRLQIKTGAFHEKSIFAMQKIVNDTIDELWQTSTNSCL